MSPSAVKDLLARRDEHLGREGDAPGAESRRCPSGWRDAELDDVRVRRPEHRFTSAYGTAEGSALVRVGARARAAAAGKARSKVGWVRKAVYSLIAGAGALWIGGCGSGHSTASAPQPRTARSTPASLGSFGGRPQAAVLRLARGHSTARFVITAVPHDTWVVRISAPASADFEANVLTSDGERLSILETTHQREACARDGTRLHCFLRFAIGANQTPGHWTVIARKRTDPAITMRIQITFYRPGSE
jgi:hypothetical protein